MVPARKGEVRPVLNFDPKHRSVSPSSEPPRTGLLDPGGAPRPVQRHGAKVPALKAPQNFSKAQDVFGTGSSDGPVPEVRRNACKKFPVAARRNEGDDFSPSERRGRGKKVPVPQRKDARAADFPDVFARNSQALHPKFEDFAKKTLF